MFRKYLLPHIVYWFYRIWTSTWRKQIVESEELKSDLNSQNPLIFAHWHGDELAIVFLVNRYRLSTMTSTSKDGQLIDYVIRKLGGATSKGSSTRGGIGALKGLIRLVKSGRPASMAVDGPKGPIHKVKPGVFELSRLAKAKIYPVGVASSNSIIFQKSWNKAHLPRPFSKVVICYGKPLSPLSKEMDIKSPQMADDLATQIFDARQQAFKTIADN